MASKDLQVDLGVHAVIGRNYHGKTTDHVLQNGKPLLYVILAVHAQLGGAAAGGDHNGLIGAGCYQRGSLDHGMGGSGTETTGIGTGGVHKAGDLSSRLGKVTAAALVHITAGLFGTVDNILYLVLIDTGVLNGCQQGKNRRSLGNQVFMHNMSGKI